MPPNVTTYEEMSAQGADTTQVSAAVAFLSEMGYDTKYFDEAAYRNLIAALRTYPGLTGVVLDGAISRLDRPEFLCAALTYWKGTTVEMAKLLMQESPSHEHMSRMLNQQFEILSNRLGELREALPEVTIVYSFRDDELAHTVSKMLNERMIAQVSTITAILKKNAGAIKQHKFNCKTAKADLARLKRQKGQAVRRARQDARRRLENNETAIGKLNLENQRLSDEQEAFRTNKARAMHQAMTAEFMAELFAKVQAICIKHGVVLVTHDALLRFGSLSFYYAHSGHKTWGVVKKRPQDLRESVQGRMREFFDDLKDDPAHKARDVVRAVTRQRVDAVVESAHSGRPFTSVLKNRTLMEEINFRNGQFDSPVSDQFVRVLSVMPFESRRLLSDFVSGLEPVRLAGSKAVGSRNSRAVDRYHAGSPCGLSLLTKSEAGRVGVHWVKYADFERGSGIKALGQVIATASDEHIGGPFMLPTVLRGWTSLVQCCAQEPFPFLSQTGQVVGVVSPGDQVDANSHRWPFSRAKPNRNPQEVYEEAVRKLTRMGRDIVSIHEMATHMASIATGGTVESMDDIMNWATDYLWKLLMAVLPNTQLQMAMVRIPGNHSGDALANLGMTSNAYLEQRLKALGIPYFKVGNPEYINPDEAQQARVHLGGFGKSLVGGVENYGRALDGSYLFGPIRLYVNHNPKGPEMTGLISAGKGAAADVVIAGHTHEFYVCPYRLGDDNVGFAVRVATLEGVTDVELYYASELLRVQGALLMSMPVPGQFAEEFVPASELRQEGQLANVGLVQDEISSLE